MWWTVVRGVPQGSVFGPLLFLLYTSELYSILENKLIGYADGFILMAYVPPKALVKVAESLMHDLGKVRSYLSLSRMNIASPSVTPLTIGRTELKECDELEVFGVTVYSKMTFE